LWVSERILVPCPAARITTANLGTTFISHR
jgi:hypothetical protein